MSKQLDEKVRKSGYDSYSHLLFLELRVLHAAPAVIRPSTPLSSFCAGQLRNHCAAHSLTTPFFSTTVGELPGFWGSMVFCHAPIRRKRSGNNNNLVSGLNSMFVFSGEGLEISPKRLMY